MSILGCFHTWSRTGFGSIWGWDWNIVALLFGLASFHLYFVKLNWFANRQLTPKKKRKEEDLQVKEEFILLHFLFLVYNPVRFAFTPQTNRTGVHFEENCLPNRAGLKPGFD